MFALNEAGNGNHQNKAAGSLFLTSIHVGGGGNAGLLGT
jgi:hypothetical protein